MTRQRKSLQRRPPRIRGIQSFLWLCAAAGCFFPAVASHADSEEKSPLRVLLYGDPPEQPVTAETAANLEHSILLSFAQAQGRPLEAIWTRDFPSVLERLENEEVDIAGAVLSITPERLERFDFSIPYFPSLPILIERRGEESTDLEDLHGHRVATIEGSTHAIILGAERNIELVYEKSRACFEMASAGEVRAAALPSFVYLMYAEEFPDLVPTLPLSERTFLGFAFRQGDPTRADLDEHLLLLKKDGRIREFLIGAYGQYGFESIEALVDGLFE